MTGSPVHDAPPPRRRLAEPAPEPVPGASAAATHAGLGEPYPASERTYLWGSSADNPDGPIRLEEQPAQFELAYSGGWGTPERTGPTGPMPRLGRLRRRHTEDTVHGLPADSPTRWLQTTEPAALLSAARARMPRMRQPSAPAAVPAPEAPAEPEPAPQAAQADHAAPADPAVPEAPGAGPRPRGSSVTAALADAGMTQRVTRKIAPAAYVTLLAWLIVSFIADVYTAIRRLATLDAGAVDVIFSVVTGLAFVALGALAGRLFIELCCNVADLTGRSDSGTD